MKGPRAYCFCDEYGVRCASELRCWSVLGDERAVETRALRIWWQQRAHRSTVGCDSITTRLSAAFRPLRPRVRLAPECLRATRQSLNGQRPSGAHHDRRFLLKASNGPLTRNGESRRAHSFYTDFGYLILHPPVNNFASTPRGPSSVLPLNAGGLNDACALPQCDGLARPPLAGSFVGHHRQL